MGMKRVWLRVQIGSVTIPEGVAVGAFLAILSVLFWKLRIIDTASNPALTCGSSAL
jgi:hypothetical protein